MKLIIAIIRPERLAAVQEALQSVLDEEDRYRITVDSVEGHGAAQGEVELFRGQRIRPRLVPRTRVMVAVNETYVQKAVDAIVSAARTEGGGAVGDGKIFIQALEDVIRIRTGERGSSAV
jgi:nitrogen regulatory protein PII